MPTTAPIWIGCGNAGESGESETAPVPRDLQPVDPPEKMSFTATPAWVSTGPLFDKPGNDALDQRDLGVFEPLETATR